MKTKSFLAMGMIAALAVGCSSDDIVDGGGDNNNGNNGGGKAFVSLNITLPSSNGSASGPFHSATRSENNQFDHGTANEYQVNKLTVIYFYNDANGNQQFVRTYQPEDLSWTKPADPANGITTTAVLPVEEVPFNGTAKVLVAVNTPAGLEVNQDNEVQAPTAEQLTGTSRNSFFMTNVVNDEGEYLVEVKSYAKKTDAQEHASENSIYVERAVGKVQLFTDWTGEYSVASGVNEGAKVTIDNWKLDVTNKLTYPIRKFDATSLPITDYARFYCGDPNRTYWAQDPNYDNYNSTLQHNNFNVITDVNDINNAVGSIEYCLENTFNTKHQKQDETTRVLAKATFVPKELVSDAEYLAGDKTWYTLGNSTKGYSATDVKEAIQAAYSEAGSSINLSDITLKEIFLTAGTQKEIEKTSFDVNGAEPSDEQLAVVKNRLGKVTTYLQGKCYYAIRIKHLDYYCPWGAPDYKDYVYVDDAERDAMEKTYLGRYGVVRNNWYKVTINSVSQPGSPLIPELTTNCDDEQKYYLQATINIQDWAVRNQGVDL